MELPERFWLKSYPAGIPTEIDPGRYSSLLELLEESFTRFAERIAYSCMGADLRFDELDRRSAAVSAWLQSQGVKPGDRVAIMLPNVLHFPVAFFGALRAGATVVNVNPLYTPHELEFQLKDSGAETLFVLENFAHTVQTVLDKVPTKRIVLCSMGEMFTGPKSWIVDFVVRHVKGLVRPFRLPRESRFRFRQVLAQGSGQMRRPVPVGPQDVAVLQYTGGTTGISKGAMLLHRNLVANILQAEAWNQPALRKIKNGEQPITVTALPLYHIFALTCCALISLRTGGQCLLIPNPRDFPALVGALRGRHFHSFPAVNTLYNVLASDEAFRKLDFSALVLSVGGGMAVQRVVAERWLQLTGCPICEGYGLSETSPSACCNPTDTDRFNGTIGLPLPSTEVAILDDSGARLPIGTPGEIGIRGPQVMAGYWQRPDETAKVMTADGFLRTGDIGVMDERGYTRIVDRKKDMILMSGFNVYPNEVEDVVAAHPGVLECAVIGIPDEHSGEAVKLFVVRKDPSLTAESLAAYCHENLTGYKRPKVIEFRSELPKTNVGKILRRELRR
ncbi:acyl-CoA synthetase (long-chain-fatty-acid--CoA ligase) [Burkholderiales bacterium]|nr:acyl-CoA synthetase (long-chain-fatty-acid--CoA ligase) [Burkholderiales bacterium]